MIHAEHLTNDYRAGQQIVHAVRGIDLEVADGEFVAILGPNGASKSTTLRMLTTLTSPTSGRAVVAGADVTTEPATVRARIGYVGQGTAGSLNQRVVDELRVQARIHGLRGSAATDRVAELLTAFQLETLSRRKVSALSGGQRRRLDVAIGLVHTPRLLFLDEPSTGLDPHSLANLWEHVLRARDLYGMTIVLTTHYLEEADGFAERVVVVDEGRVIADDSPTRLKATLAGDRIMFRGADERALACALNELTGGTTRTAAGEVAVGVADAPSAVPGLLRALEQRGVGVSAVSTAAPTLDDVFLALTGRSLREHEATDDAVSTPPTRAA